MACKSSETMNPKMSATQSQDSVLTDAIQKLALAGELAGFSIDDLIEMLDQGASAETLLELVYCRMQYGYFHPVARA